MNLFIILVVIADFKLQFKCHKIDFYKKILFVSTLVVNREFIVETAFSCVNPIFFDNCSIQAALTLS